MGGWVGGFSVTECPCFWQQFRLLTQLPGCRTREGKQCPQKLACPVTFLATLILSPEHCCLHVWPLSRASRVMTQRGNRRGHLVCFSSPFSGNWVLDIGVVQLMKKLGVWELSYCNSCSKHPVTSKSGTAKLIHMSSWNIWFSVTQCYLQGLFENCCSWQANC